MVGKGYLFEIITDIGSGINYNKKGLKQLVAIIINSEVEKNAILSQDRLLSFGAEIIDNTERTEDQELVEDLNQIIMVFSCWLRGKGANKAKKMMKELLESDRFNQSQT